MPTPSFNWITFLLGFAIALWIAIVVLFLLPEDPEPAAPPVACHVAGCGGCCGGDGPVKPRTLWHTPGSDKEFCTNNDNGGGYVEDNGGGYIDDNGGGYVDDSWPRVPAPTDEDMGRGRNGEEFQCRSNDNGGGYVEDASRRTVALPMPNTNRYACLRTDGGHASVVRIEGPSGSEQFWRVRFDWRQNPVLLDQLTLDPAEQAALLRGGIAAVPADEWLFCMVPLETTDIASAEPAEASANEARLLREGGACVENCP